MASFSQSPNRHALVLGLFYVVAVGVLVGCGADDDGTVQAPPLPVQVVNAVRRDVPLSIEMVGSTLGTQDVPIRARVEGFLETMNFEEGRFVKKDELLIYD
jgi:multidrug efflux pump subunit AcrA (membrane-fusion protein)